PLKMITPPGLAAFQRTATRETPGRISLSGPSRFTASSGKRVASPVTFPPGRARLATNPWPTGSETATATMGIVVVACFAARAAGPPVVTMRSTLRRTRSAARSGNRTILPSANRHSSDREIGGLRTFEYLVYVDGGASIVVRKV